MGPEEGPFPVPYWEAGRKHHDKRHACVLVEPASSRLWFECFGVATWLSDKFCLCRMLGVLCPRLENFLVWMSVLRCVEAVGCEKASGKHVGDYVRKSSGAQCETLTSRLNPASCTKDHRLQP